MFTIQTIGVIYRSISYLSGFLFGKTVSVGLQSCQQRAKRKSRFSAILVSYRIIADCLGKTYRCR